jgi:lipopolysaccharide heptosyltransferase I
MSKRVLLIKLTSMGDLMHALPAITDATQAIPGIEFDWVVDEAFAEVPSWHPAVNTVIKSAHRRWRKKASHYLLSGELLGFYRQLNAGEYDVMLDAQNNIKSAIITWLRRGKSHGLDKSSAREQPAHWAYAYHHTINRSQHAITRQRQLFARALGYTAPTTPPIHGVDHSRMLVPEMALPERYLLFVHNASWTTKLWPEQHWLQLIEQATQAGFHVLLPCGNDEEYQRAQHLAKDNSHAHALPKLSLTHIAGIIKNAAGTVCCDTGLAHLASMLDIPSVSLYGPTDHKLIGAMGLNQFHAIADSQHFHCAPCYKKLCNFNADQAPLSACMLSLTPDLVWKQLQYLMKSKEKIIVSN